MTTNICQRCGISFQAKRSAVKYCSKVCISNAKSDFFSLHNPRAKPLQERFFEKVTKGKEGECWVWTGAINANGYGTILADDRVQTASRVSYEMHCGPISDGLHVLHHCDNRRCVNPAHLYLGDNQQNVNDRTNRNRVGGIGKKGASAGQNNVNASLNESQVREIRASGLDKEDLARIYGVTTNCISWIKSRKTWRHI